MSTRALITHLMLYLTVTGALAIAWATLGAGYPWFAWPMLVWGVALALHAVRYAADSAVRRLPRY